MNNKIKDILLIGPDPSNEKINHPGGQLTAMVNLIGYLKENKVEYEILDVFRSSFPSPSMKEKLVGGWKKYRELKQLLKNNRYKGALVFGTHGLGYWEKLLFSLMIEKQGIKTLFFIRSGHFMQSVLDKKYNVPFKKYFMNKLSYIGYQGGTWGNFYNKLGIQEEKMVKILNWIDIQIYDREFVVQKPTFLYVGWMVEKKGVRELIEVILDNKDLDEYHFIFVGGGTLLDELKEKVESVQSQNITFTGWLESDELKAYYKKVDTLILPSHAEGFPNVILEGLSYQLPIIATNVGGIAESVLEGYNGFLLEPKDKEKLYKSIKKLASSEQIRREFSKNSAKTLVENHAIDVNCQKILDLFKD